MQKTFNTNTTLNLSKFQSPDYFQAEHVTLVLLKNPFRKHRWGIIFEVKVYLTSIIVYLNIFNFNIFLLVLYNLI